MSNLFVCVLGMGTVFLGLICIIVLCKITSAICSSAPKKAEEKTSSDVKATNLASVAPIANKQEIIAAVCAVVAEECGTDVKNIKVVSFKRA